jgi:hypothetical protein
MNPLSSREHLLVVLIFYRHLGHRPGFSTVPVWQPHKELTVVAGISLETPVVVLKRSDLDKYDPVRKAIKEVRSDATLRILDDPV